MAWAQAARGPVGPEVMSHEMDSEIVPEIMDVKYMKVTTGYEDESKHDNENPMLTTSTPVTLTNQNFSEFSG